MIYNRTKDSDPRKNANPSIISFTFGIIKNGLPVYYEYIINSLISDYFFNISHGNPCCVATTQQEKIR